MNSYMTYACSMILPGWLGCCSTISNLQSRTFRRGIMNVTCYVLRTLLIVHTYIYLRRVRWASSFIAAHIQRIRSSTGNRLLPLFKIVHITYSAHCTVHIYFEHFLLRFFFFVLPLRRILSSGNVNCILYVCNLWFWRLPISNVPT